MKYKVGDIITVRVTIVNIGEDGDLECCHVGCEKDYFDEDKMGYSTDMETFEEDFEIIK